jgi:hypothetical protein
VNNNNKNDYNKVMEMKEDEKFISFLNRYFIFKKTNEVDTKTVFKMMTEAELLNEMFDKKNKPKEEEDGKKEENKDNGKKDNETPADKKPFAITKIRSNFVIGKFSPMEPDEIEGDRTAIIIPYREQKGEKRKEQLNKMIEYMADYLDEIHHKIFIIEQKDDGRKFNRGKLLNAGFKIAQEEGGFNKFIFHDVDLLPSMELKKYYLPVKTKSPIHIANVWKERYDYDTYFGGVVAFPEEIFENINGFPNNFWGWGGEDDVLFYRTQKLKYPIDKPTDGSFKDLENMTFQQKNEMLKQNGLKNMTKTELIKEDRKIWKSNGLNNLKYVVESKTPIETDSVKYTVNIDM